MAVRSKEELLEAIKARVGNDDSDEVLSFLEDVSDTIGDYENRVYDREDWKSRYEENDRSWRQRYRDRFFGGPEEGETVEVQEDRVEETPEETEITSFEDLFKEE